MKDKTVKKNAIKRALSIVLALAMVITLMPLSSMTVYAESTTSITDAVATRIKNANTTSTYDSSKLNTLYGVRERNLTSDDIVTVNGVECYVLSVDTENNTAQLITKNIYDQRFNNTNTGAAAEYTYSSSDLKTYMDNFYLTTLASDSRIIDHEVTSYTSTAYDPYYVANYTKSTITQKVYALDAAEAEANKSKFGSPSWFNYNEYRDSAYTNDCYSFWVSAGCVDGADSKGFIVDCFGGLGGICTSSTDGGVRPTFTIDLTVSPSTTSHTHTGTKVNGQSATCTSDGWNDYYQCTDTECNKVFSDSECTSEITDLATWKKTTGKKIATGHDFTGEYKVTKEATATTDGKKETSCKNGCGTKKVVVIPATGSKEEDPTNGKLSKDAEVAKDAPVESASLDNSKKNLMEASGIFTEEEKTAIANGDDAKVYLAIENLNEAEVPAESKTNITTVAQKELGTNTTIKYMDVSLFKQIGNNPAEKVSEPGTTINVTIEIPTLLRNKETGKYRKYRIIREHDGKVTVIKGKFNSATGEYSFGTDAFSTYAIAYEDETMTIDLGTTPTEKTFDKIGDSFQITASVTPAEAEQKLTYESSNPAVATVDENGLVTAVGSGTAVITIKNADGSVAKTITVTVIDKNSNEITINAGLKVSQTNKSLGVKWGKVAGADGYMVYATYCGTKFTDKPVKTTKKTSVSITKLNGKKIDQKKNIKVYVEAYKIVDGKKIILGKSITAHVVGTKNTKNTNVKSVKITSKTKLSLAVGKTSKIKAKVTLVNKKRKQLSAAHAATFRYASSDVKVATVTTEGKIQAVGAGTCYVYVYAKNGYAKKVKVTVK